MTAPPPRLVPDRPSDAAIAQAFRECGDMPPTNEDWEWIEMRAKQIDAAAPPAEAPAERGEAIRKEVEFAIVDHCKGGDLWLASKLAADKIAKLAAAPAGEAADDVRCTWCGNVQSANPLSHKPSCRVRTHPQSEQAKRAASYRAAPDAPAPDTAGWLPKDNDGKEQDAFEAWAEGEGFDMHQHPLHWLFLNERTNAARRGWRGALAYVTSKAPRVTGGREEQLREALADLLSWFPDKPVPAEWRLPAGTHGADDAITAAHDALGHKTCRFCAWRGVPETAADPYTTDGTVEVCGGCNNAESCV